MSNQKSLRVSSDIFTRFNQFKIRLASDIGRIPLTSETVNAFLVIADKHYEEIIGIIRDTK